MLHIPGLSHRHHRKHTADAQQAAVATTSPLQRADLDPGSTGQSPAASSSPARYATVASDPYAGQHVVAETHHLRYLPIKKRHGLFRKPTHHMYEFDTRFHGLSSAIAPHTSSSMPVPTSAAPPAAAPGVATTTSRGSTIHDNERVPVVKPPVPRRYGTDISTTRRMASPDSNPVGPSPLATVATAVDQNAQVTGVERTQVSTITTPDLGDGQDARQLLIKTTTRATPALVVDAGHVGVASRAETASMVTAPMEHVDVARVDYDNGRHQEDLGERERAASISTNDMYARAFEDASPHPPIMPAGDWVETHYRTESGRFQERVRRE